MHKMAFAHVFGPEKTNGFGPFSYKFFVCIIRVGLRPFFMGDRNDRKINKYGISVAKRL